MSETDKVNRRGVPSDLSWFSMLDVICDCKRGQEKEYIRHEVINVPCVLCSTDIIGSIARPNLAPTSHNIGLEFIGSRGSGQRSKWLHLWIS